MSDPIPSRTTLRQAIQDLAALAGSGGIQSLNGVDKGGAGSADANDIFVDGDDFQHTDTGL